MCTTPVVESNPATTSAATGDLGARLLTATVHALELASIYLGTELGLYTALSEAGPLTADQLAERAGIAPRYAREWLEQQAVAGFLRVDRPDAPARDRRYELPAEHRPVLASVEDPSHLAPLASMLAGIGGALPAVVKAYRSGGGVPYTAYGDAFRRGQGGINRPAFVADLGERWLPAAEDVHARLRALERPRIADVGCGLGWSTIGLARAYPHAEVIGYDADRASIDEARANAAANGVDVRFEVRDARTLPQDQPFDLVVILEALHDMSQPVEVLEAARASLAPGGAVLVADEKVADRFEAPGDENERLMYGWSVTHCLPVAMHASPSAAIGTVIRSDVVRQLAAQAGFTRTDILPVDAGFFRLYALA